MSTKYAASLSLAIMGLGFLISLLLPETTAVFLLRGGFEAGLVGGAADWFAVTALFRHPFGIPIPHTSLLIRNRGKMVEALVSAMENELLNKRSIEEKLRKIRMLSTATRAMDRLIRKRSFRVAILNLTAGLLRRIPDEQAARFVRNALADTIRGADMKGAAGGLLSAVTDSGLDRKLLDYGLKEAAEWAMRTETRLVLGRLANERLGGVKVGGVMGFAVQAFAGFMDEDKLGGLIQEMLLSSLRQLAEPDNPYRQRILHDVRTRFHSMLGDKERMSGLQERAARWVLEEQAAGEWILAGVADMRRRVMDALMRERAEGGRAVFQVYRSIYRGIQNEPGWAEELEERLTRYILELVEANHYRIGRLVKENLELMDDATLVRLVEEKLGKDLQWIRVNGAICGFLVGLLLSAVQLGSR